MHNLVILYDFWSKVTNNSSNVEDVCSIDKRPNPLIALIKTVINCSVGRCIYWSLLPTKSLIFLLYVFKDTYNKAIVMKDKVFYTFIKCDTCQTTNCTIKSSGLHYIRFH